MWGGMWGGMGGGHLHDHASAKTIHIAMETKPGAQTL